MYHIFYIFSSMRGRLGCFQVLAVMNTADMNIVEQVSLWNDWASFRYMPKWHIGGSWGRLIFSFLINLYIDFQSSCTSLHSHQQWRSIPLVPHPLQHKLSLIFLILVILTNVTWYLRVILIGISLMTKDVEQFFNCLFTIWDSFVENSV